MGPKLNFEKYLIENKVLTVEALKTAVIDAQSRKLTLHQALIEKGILSEESLAQAQAKFHGLDYYPGPLPFNPELVSQFPIFTLRRYKIIPLAKTPQQVTIATSNPGNFLATDEVRRLTRLEVKTVCTTDSAVMSLLNQVSGEGGAILSTAKSDAKDGAPPPSTDELTSGTAAHIDQILLRCIARRASDVHFEPQSHFAMVRERIDGVLYEVERMPTETFAPVLSRLKLLCGMDIVEKRLAQDGRFKYEGANKQACEIRGSTLPTIFGEKLVLRLLRADTAEPSLEMLDIGKERMDAIHKICELPDGLVLIAGPTGCGKTTTIYAVLSRLDRRSQNLIMVEDPVEYEMEYANQVQINSKIGVTFSSILPNILRQDPDLLMVGEIREEATAQMVMRAAISGHLVFSTIHAPNALQTVSRLLDMGIEPHMVVASLKSCISQRLLRKLCSQCKKPREATADEKKLLEAPEDKPLKIFVEGGCEQCHHLGYSGRFAVMEVLMVDDSMRDSILKHDEPMLAKLAVAKGFRTMKQHAATRVIAGDTSLKELLANCP